jgi:ferredoxin
MRSIHIGPACIGSGQCEMLAPEVFEVGDDGRAHVRADVTWPPADDQTAHAVRNALDSCPTRALQETS